MKLDDRIFARLIEAPKLVGAGELDELAKVAEKYPYFSLAKLLYLKGLKLNQEVNFASALTHISTHAPSVEWLYLYLSESDALFVEAELDEEASSKPAEEEAVVNVAAAEVAVELAPKQEAPEAEGSKPTEEEAVTNVAAVEIAAEPVPEQEAPKAEEVVAQAEVAVTDKAPEAAIEEEQAPQQASEEEAELFEEEPFELIDDELESDTDDPIFEILDQKLYTLDDSEKNLEIQNSLIDQFLSANPRIVPKADLPVENEDISMKSLEDDGEIVTETLAKVYAAQGLIEKAADIYTKLCLKYPEKKAYFVAQLEKLNDQSK